jgi:hypothetical protein
VAAVKGVLARREEVISVSDSCSKYILFVIKDSIINIEKSVACGLYFKTSKSPNQ